ncbi:MAG: hypothetical protein KDI55_00065 [Anaerolineae bacterium]|nr:hypothetical protein [Anaerolineae bacterium]
MSTGKLNEIADAGPLVHTMDWNEIGKACADAGRRIAELEAALRAIASRDIPHPNADWAEVEFAAEVCDRLGITYETKWDQ